MNKHAKMGSGMIFGLVIVGLIVWAVSKNPATPATPPSTGPSPSTTAACDALVTPQATINCYNENDGSALAAINGSFRKVGDTTWLEWRCSEQTPVLECGSTYEFVTGTNYASTDQGQTIDEEFGPYFKVTVPNQETFTQDIQASDNSDPTNITYRMLDSLGNAAAQAIGSGGSEKIGVSFRAADNLEFGNNFIASSGLSTCKQGQSASTPNVLCLYLNDTELQAIDSLDVNGQPMSTVNTPTGKGNNRFNYSAPTATMQCWGFPVVKDTSWTTASFTVKAETGQNPTNHTGDANTVSAQYTSALLNASQSGMVILYAGDLYVDEETNKLECGVVDDDNNMTATNVPFIGPLIIT